MNQQDNPVQQLMWALQERAKELNCLYQIDEILADPTRPLSSVCPLIVEAIPPGWKYPEDCEARIALRKTSSQTAGFRKTPWTLTTPIFDDVTEVGTLTVCYTEEKPPADEGPFLKEEQKLLSTIAQRIGFFVTRRNLRQAHLSLESAQNQSEKSESAEWNVILDFLRRTDPDLLRRITRRMINYLELAGVKESERLLRMCT